MLKTNSLSIVILILISSWGCTLSEEKEVLPNIVFILADDLGYGETGAYGQEIIRTPNIDALARSGLKFTQHYAGSPVCAPSRYILLTGQHAGHAFIRGNDEWNERGDVWDFKAMLDDPTLEGQRPIPDSTVTIAELLKTKGYTTGLFGKWGLGAPQTKGVPTAQGFDTFYGYNCQRQAHSLYPTHLWHNDERVYLNNDFVAPHTSLDTASDPNDWESYRAFEQTDYAPAKIHESALDFIQSNAGQPFFLYYASPLPHLPLQVPNAERSKYRDLIRENEPYKGDRGYFPNQYPRAAYAAMISYLDQQVGELIQQLKDQGIYENTLIILTSDNGPTYTGGVDFDFFDSSLPFSNGYGRTKGFVYEGGIRVPMIASWSGKIQPGISDHISAFYDWLPTLCEVAGVPIPPSTDGISILPTLLGNSQSQHEFLYWEFPSYQGQQAVRMGDFKAIRQRMFEGNLEIELYNVTLDPLEQTDLADQFPEQVQRAIEIMEAEHKTAQIERFRFPVLGETK